MVTHSGEAVGRLKNLEDLFFQAGVKETTSRVHPLHFDGPPNCQVFVKREDELGFGVSGGKLRKYQSLLPFLLRQKVCSALIIGGAYSNNVVSLCQRLIENAIQPFLFLKGKSPPALQGNFLLTRLFVPSSHIHWVAPDQWKNVEAIAKQQQANYPQPSQIIPEGACMPEALPGALTLATDILKNQQQAGKNFDHIFIEAGTGLAAIGLILGLEYLQERPIHIHILLLADTKDIFLEKLTAFRSFFHHLVGHPSSHQPSSLTCHFYTPSTAKSFGAVNRQIISTITKIARTQGFLTDPIYSAKLFREAFQIINTQDIQGNILVIHSGGALTLMGFTELLGQAIDT